MSNKEKETHDIRTVDEKEKKNGPVTTKFQLSSRIRINHPISQVIFEITSPMMTHKKLQSLINTINMCHN